MILFNTIFSFFSMIVCHAIFLRDFSGKIKSFRIVFEGLLIFPVLSFIYFSKEQAKVL